MKLEAHEVYGQSSHYWYLGELMKAHDYGQIVDSDLVKADEIVQIIQADLAKEDYAEGNFWYFGTSLEQIIWMIRILDGEVDIQVNLKDFDFALNLDALKVFKTYLEDQLVRA